MRARDVADEIQNKCFPSGAANSCTRVLAALAACTGRVVYTYKTYLA